MDDFWKPLFGNTPIARCEGDFFRDGLGEKLLLWILKDESDFFPRFSEKFRSIFAEKNAIHFDHPSGGKEQSVEMLPSVDLPLPVCPTTLTQEPGSTRRFTPSRARLSRGVPGGRHE
jgi:hypothetical protein